MNKKTVVKALTATGFGYGMGALLAPGPLHRLYGTSETTPELRVMSRMWGAATLTIAATVARAQGKDLDAMLLMVGIGNLISAAAEATAVSDGLSPKVAALGAASSGAVAAAALYARALD